MTDDIKYETGDEEIKIEFIAVLELILKLLEIGKIEEAKDTIKKILSRA